MMAKLNARGLALVCSAMFAPYGAAAQTPAPANEDACVAILQGVEKRLSSSVKRLESLKSCPKEAEQRLRSELDQLQKNHAAVRGQLGSATTSLETTKGALQEAMANLENSKRELQTIATRLNGTTAELKTTRAELVATKTRFAAVMVKRLQTLAPAGSLSGCEEFRVTATEAGTFALSGRLRDVGALRREIDALSREVGGISVDTQGITAVSVCGLELDGRFVVEERREGIRPIRSGDIGNSNAARIPQGEKDCKSLGQALTATIKRTGKTLPLRFWVLRDGVNDLKDPRYDLCHMIDDEWIVTDVMPSDSQGLLITRREAAR
jgi:hypothetical protein